MYINVNNNLRLPETSGNYALGHGAREEVILRYRDGSSFTTKYRTDGGNLYLCAAPLDPQYSNLTKSAEVFVPMVYKMALSRGAALKVAHTIGRDASIEVENKSSNIDKNTYKMRFADANNKANNKVVAAAPTEENADNLRKASLKPSNAQTEFIPEQRTIGARVALNIGTNIKEAGYYDLFLKPDSTQQVFAFNYDRRESVLDYLGDTEMAAFGTKQVNVLKSNANTNFVELVGERSRGIVLWKWCVIFVLLFLLAESLLLRFWKK